MIYNEDCVSGAKKHLADSSVDLFICDPPFGIGESSFDGQHYNRNSENVLEGYVEAPENYEKWADEWVGEMYRTLKETGTAYIISGWTNLRELMNSCHNAGFTTQNHIIWKYDFGVYTRKKFVSSHYHILRLSKVQDNSKLTFNTNCRFSDDDRYDKDGVLFSFTQEQKDEFANKRKRTGKYVSKPGTSAVYKDMEDVFAINKQNMPGAVKNNNKLPDELVSKMIEYSSNPGDVVCDFFMGNFTTAYCSTKLNRNVVGFEMNKEAYDYHINNRRDNGTFNKKYSKI